MKMAEKADWEEAAKQEKRQLALRGRGIAIQLSINLSANDLLDAELPEMLGQTLATWDVPAASLTLEITETMMVEESWQVIDVLERLRQLGAASVRTVALDVFTRRPVVADGAAAFEAGQARQPRGTASAAPQSIGDVRIERDGNQRWLVVNRPADKLWEPVREFWLENGFTLMLESFEIHIPKGYIYFAMAFSVCVEMINIRLRKRITAPVHLRKDLPY